MCVNKQEQFKAGQRDIDNDGFLTELQAAEARESTPGEREWKISSIEEARKYLQANGYDLEEE